MLFKRLPTGMFASNCYIIGDRGEGVIIDPGAKSDEIMAEVENMELVIKYILITHAHIDHICSIDKIREATGAEVLAHELDANYLSDPWYNASALFGLNRTYKNADRGLKDGDTLEVGGLKLEIIHTPGHTPGGICIKVDNILFSGDTLFRMSYGRTDLGNGDEGEMRKSLDRLMKMDGNITVYPGHGTSTTIGYERDNNPLI